MSEQDDSRKQNKDNGADALSTDYAVALGYDHTKQAAPKVLAKGQGPIAQKIVQIAIDEGIEILTGLPAGERDAAGNDPENTINGKVQKRLNQFLVQNLEYRRQTHVPPKNKI